MEFEKDLIRKKLLDPDLQKLIDGTHDLTYGKQIEASEKARERGNLQYVQDIHNSQIHESTLKFFTKSIAYAPAISEQLALGYGNRSALLFHLKRFECSIKDIDKALSITKNKTLKIKLLCRKVECLTALGLPESSHWFEKVVECFNDISDDDIQNKNKLHTIISKTKTVLEEKKLLPKRDENSIVFENKPVRTGDFSLIGVKNSTKHGRHLIAAQHIKPGEIIYEEKPFVVCSNMEQSYTNCSHCLAIAWNGVPCKQCNWSIFCSTTCRKEAWTKYHDVECPVITRMIGLDRQFSQNFQMSLRAVVMGIRECGGINKLREELQSMNASEDNSITNLLEENKSGNSQFCKIFNLSSTIKDKHAEINIFNTAITLCYAAKYTTLFGQNAVESEACNSLVKNEDILFTGCLLLKLVQICNNYAYTFTTSPKLCQHAKETVRCLKKYCKDKMTYLAPVSGLINNSCIPNARRCFTRDQKIIVYALDSIAKNSQIFESYISSFYETPTSVDRKAVMSNYFKFICDCVACTKNWPSLTTILLGTQSFTPLSSTTDVRTNFLELQLADDYISVVKQATGKGTVCDEKTILELRKGIEKTAALLAQPSKIRCTLMFCMGRVFDKIYSHDPNVFSCKS